MTEQMTAPLAPLITPARTADADEIIGLWRTCGLTRPWNDPATDFALALREQNATVLIARADGAIAGSVMVGFDGHRGWVYYLGVAPGRRGTGLGRALMTAGEAWLRDRGAPKVQLMVRGDNTAALGFYEALGLVRQDVVVLGRLLSEGVSA